MNTKSKNGSKEKGDYKKGGGIDRFLIRSAIRGGGGCGGGGGGPNQPSNPNRKYPFFAAGSLSKHQLDQCAVKGIDPDYMTGKEKEILGEII